MKIYIDEKELEFLPEDKNIVDVAIRADFPIPAPCYYAKQENRCCNACVVEINGEKEFACSTKPVDGMKIILNRKDLRYIRRERIKAYNANKDTTPSPTGSCSMNCNCDCSSGCPSEK